MIIDYNNPAHRIRLEVGDMLDVSIFPDSIYQAIYDESGGDLNVAIVKAAYNVLAYLSQLTRERLDRIEFYGNQRAEQYIKFLEAKIKQLSGTDVLPSNFNVYAGGLYKDDMQAKASNTNLNRWTSPFDSCSTDDYNW